MNFFVLHCQFSDQCAPHFVREFLLTLKLPSLLAKFCYWLTSGHYFSFLNYVSQHQTRNSALHPIPCDYSLFLLIHIFEFLIFGTFFNLLSFINKNHSKISNTKIPFSFSFSSSLAFFCSQTFKFRYFFMYCLFISPSLPLSFTLSQ